MIRWCKRNGTVLWYSSFLVSSKVLLYAIIYLSMECYCGNLMTQGTNIKKLLQQFLPESSI